MPQFPPVAEQLEYIKKGVSEIIREPELLERLEKSRQTGKPLRVYAGFDPTAPDLHLGHTVLLRKLKHFQDLGHTAIFLIGDGTALIGDPTGRNALRPPLSREQIDKNAETYKAQVFKILDESRTEVRYNSEWLHKLGFEGMIRLSAKYTVSQMLERDEFHKRFQDEVPISLHELLYPLAQGYDSFMLECDVQLGGTDQKFNLQVSRDIQRAYGMTQPEIIITTPLLEGLDGVQKMSKSYGNYVGITDAPLDMYGKLMSITDELMWRYWELLTDTSMQAIHAMQEQAKSGTLHPMKVKKGLAAKIVADFHGEAAAAQASADWEKQFQKRELPTDVTEIKINYRLVEFKPGQDDPAHQILGGVKRYGVKLDQLLMRCGLADSAAEATRKIKQGAVRIGDSVADGARIFLEEIPIRLSIRVGRQIVAAEVSDDVPIIRLHGRELLEYFRLPYKHALYKKEGTWYHELRDFPGVLFDAFGCLAFDTRNEYDKHPGIVHGPDPNTIHIKKGISSLVGYRRLTPPPISLGTD